MFRFHKPIDVLTLFHAPSSASSKKILAIVRARADVTPFELDVVEAPTAPTPSQLTSILEYVGKDRVDEIVRGTRSEEEAMRVLEEAGEMTSERILRPLLVDWNNGRAVLGAHESAVISLLDTLPKR